MTIEISRENILDRGFQIQMKDRWATVFFNSAQKTIVCQLNSEYLPIEHFKSTLFKVSELVSNGDFEKFVFDKRSLKAFHQPSMEWYFVTWKKDLLGYGLTKHRKILPNENWFKKAVEVAQDELKKRHSLPHLQYLDIKYCESLEEALRI